MHKTKTAVLAVSFGTTVPEAIKANIATLEASLGRALTDCTVFRAFTSSFIRKALAKKGAAVPSTDEALASIREAGFRTVLVVPTHVLAGSEFEKVAASCHKFAYDFDELRMAKPLLSDFEDHRRALEAVSAEIPRKQGEALVLMGHGTSHPVDIAYAALNFEAIQMGMDDVYVATVEGYPSIQQTIERLQRDGFTRVCLAPFMLVAGNHAQNDMAGDGPDSWKSLCEGAGFDVRCIMRGLGEYEQIRSIYVDHALKALEDR